MEPKKKKNFKKNFTKIFAVEKKFESKKYIYKKL